MILFRALLDLLRDRVEYGTDFLIVKKKRTSLLEKEKNQSARRVRRNKVKEEPKYMLTVFSPVSAQQQEPAMPREQAATVAGSHTVADIFLDAPIPLQLLAELCLRIKTNA